MDFVYEMPNTETQLGRQQNTGSQTENSGNHPIFGNTEIVSMQIGFDDTFASLLHAIERVEDKDVVSLLVDIAMLMRQAGEPYGFRISIRGKTPFFEEVVRGISEEHLFDNPYNPISEDTVLSRWGIILRSPHYPGNLRQLEAVAFRPLKDDMEMLVQVKMPNNLIRRMPDHQVYEAAWNLQDIFSRQMGSWGVMT